MTTIGSPNFGYRSIVRDLEAQLFLVTSNLGLRKSLHEVILLQFRVVVILQGGKVTVFLTIKVVFTLDPILHLGAEQFTQVRLPGDRRDVQGTGATGACVGWGSQSGHPHDAMICHARAVT